MGSRDAGSENFPVASRLLPAWARPHVMAFYAFARTADDIADAHDLSADEKCRRLDALDQALRRGDVSASAPVGPLLASLSQTSVTADHARTLLEAFRRDALNPPTKDWDDLMDYCRLSAAPVGRYLIDLMGGADEGGYAASDALCAALQVLNHIQDIKDDATRLDRVYIPADWMAEAGVRREDLLAAQSSPALKRVIARMLDQVEGLLVAAKPLPGAIRAKALAREAGGVLAIAWRLAKALRHKDPLAGRVALSKPHAMLWFVWGALRA